MSMKLLLIILLIRSIIYFMKIITKTKQYDEWYVCLLKETEESNE